MQRIKAVYTDNNICYTAFILYKGEVFDINKKTKLNIGGFFSGIVNGFFGSGGGLVVVPALKSQGITGAKAHATSVCITTCMSFITIIIYFFSGNLYLKESLKLLPFSVIGSLVGCGLLQKCSDKLLRITFSVILIISGLRMLFR